MNSVPRIMFLNGMKIIQLLVIVVFTSREIEMLCDESVLQQFLTAFFTVIHCSPMLQTVSRYKSRNSYHFQNNTKLK